ncbi:hypothetical protein COOONC_06750 [Cooperia oncophora]
MLIEDILEDTMSAVEIVINMLDNQLNGEDTVVPMEQEEGNPEAESAVTSSNSMTQSLENPVQNEELLLSEVVVEECADYDAEVTSVEMISGLLALEEFLNSQIRKVGKVGFGFFSSMAPNIHMFSYQVRRRIEKAKRLINVKGHGLRPLIMRNVEAVDALAEYRAEYEQRVSSLLEHWKSAGYDKTDRYAGHTSSIDEAGPVLQNQDDDDDIVVLDEISESAAESARSNFGSDVDVMEVLEEVDCKASVSDGNRLTLVGMLDAENRAFATEVWRFHFTRNFCVPFYL